MAFPLKKVLKALLLSSSQPLAIKDIQAVFTRFHEQATAPALLITEPAEGTASNGAAESSNGTAEPAADATPGEVAETTAEPPLDDELYSDVPSLITGSQIREAIDEIALELRAADDGLLLIEGSAGYRLVTPPRFARWIRILRSEPPPVKLSQSSVETLAVVAYRQPVTRGEIETIRGVSAEAGINKLMERELIYIVGRADLPGRPIQYGTTDAFLEFVGIRSLDELPASDVLSSRQIDEWLKNSSSAHQPDDNDMGLSTDELPLEAGAAPAPAADGAPASDIAPDATPAAEPVDEPAAQSSPEASVDTAAVETPPATP